MQYKTPGVYIEEIAKFPPSIAAVETAIPAFIGYTERATDERGLTLRNKPRRLTSLLEYERFYGRAFPETGVVVTIAENPANVFTINAALTNPQPYRMYYAMQHFFMNGGGDCYIISVGDYTSGQIDRAELQLGLEAAKEENEITLLVFPDAQRLTTDAEFYTLYGEALDQCADLKDRFTILDVWIDPAASNPNDLAAYVNNIQLLRNGTPNEIDTLKYGAAYFPNLLTVLDYDYGARERGDEGDANVQIVQQGGNGVLTGTLAELKGKNNPLYFRARTAIRQIPLELPPSPAIAGVYATVDQSRGVWKAPANVSVDGVIRPVVTINNERQERLNVDDLSGKSINAIRAFVGRGPAIIWGARTLAGNDNEWRYVPVRRYFNFVEESVKNATVQFVFEPNDQNTWTRVKGMITNFLLTQWRAGALMGNTPEQAFFVKIGLNQTMTEEDIWAGYLIVEIGMAVVRPAEFIILRFSHKRLSESMA